MRAFWMKDLEAAGCAEEVVDGHGGLNHGVYTAPLEVVVSERGADETAARSQGSDEFVEIEWKIVERIIQQARHITFTGPAFDIAILIIAKGIEAAA